jgi:hypothetical protein
MRSGGEIAAEVYPNSALVKTTAQFLYPLPHTGELPETNIGRGAGLVLTTAKTPTSARLLKLASDVPV